MIIIFLFMKLLGLFVCLIKRLTYFRGKLIEDNSMSRKRRWEEVEILKNSMWAKLAMVRAYFPKIEFLHGLHDRYFYYQQNIFNTTEIRRSWHVGKLLNCKLVYTNETKDNLRSESQIYTNPRVTLAKHNFTIMLMGLPTSCKRYCNGVSIVTAKCEFHTTTVIRGEGEGGQSVSYKSLNCSNRCDVSESNTINIYDNLLNSNFIWEACRKISNKKGASTWRFTLARIVVPVFIRIHLLFCKYLAELMESPMRWKSHAGFGGEFLLAFNIWFFDLSKRLRIFTLLLLCLQQLVVLVTDLYQSWLVLVTCHFHV